MNTNQGKIDSYFDKPGPSSNITWVYLHIVYEEITTQSRKTCC